jgi:hypothetical protein
MSEGFSGGAAAQPPLSAPPRRGGFPTWLIILLVVLVVCALLAAIVFCVLPLAGVTLLGPAIGNVFGAVIASLGCQVENPGLDSEACTEWSNTLTSYPDAMEACQAIISGDDNSPDVASDYYNCLIDEGVPPPE